MMRRLMLIKMVVEQKSEMVMIQIIAHVSMLKMMAN